MTDWKSFLAQVKERVERATPGPWQVDNNVNCIREVVPGYCRQITLEHYRNPTDPNAISDKER